MTSCVQVDDHKVACAGKVRVGGTGLKTAEANEKNPIELDLSEAGVLFITILILSSRFLASRLSGN